MARPIIPDMTLAMPGRWITMTRKHSMAETSSSTPSDDQQGLAVARLILIVLLPFSAGYFLSYLYRAVNAVVAPDLVGELGLSASQLGLLTAAYLFGFAGFQLPLGVLLDRFGPRRVQAGLLAVTALGALLFAQAPGFIGLFLARMMIGIGSAGGLMSGFKAVALWVQEDRRALANACVMAAGGLGIMVATVPAEWASQTFGWRGMFVALSAITLVVATFIFAAVPEKASSAKPSSIGDQVRAIGHIYADGVFWRIAPLVATTCGVHIGIQTLWAGPWLRDIAMLDRDGVAAMLALCALGFLIGTLASGAVADWLGRRGFSLLTVMSGFIVLFLSSQVMILAEWTSATAFVWFLFGMFGQAGVLSYPWLASHYGAAFAGRANTAMNFLVFSAAFASQYIIGLIIDLWPQAAAGGYDAAAYRAAFLALLAVQVAGLIWFALKPPKLRRAGDQS